MSDFFDDWGASPTSDNNESANKSDDFGLPFDADEVCGMDPRKTRKIKRRLIIGICLASIGFLLYIISGFSAMFATRWSFFCVLLLMIASSFFASAIKGKKEKIAISFSITSFAIFLQISMISFMLLTFDPGNDGDNVLPYEVLFALNIVVFICSVLAMVFMILSLKGEGMFAKRKSVILFVVLFGIVALESLISLFTGSVTSSLLALKIINHDGNFLIGLLYIIFRMSYLILAMPIIVGADILFTLNPKKAEDEQMEYVSESDFSVLTDDNEPISENIKQAKPIKQKKQVEQAENVESITDSNEAESKVTQESDDFFSDIL